MAAVTVNGNVTVNGVPTVVQVDEAVTGVITATTTITAGTGIISTTGNIVATIGDVQAGAFIVHSSTSGITASTTQTQGQQPLTTEENQVSVCAHANDTVTMPAALTGRKCTITNDGANTLKVYPFSGDQIGAGAADAATTIATLRGVTYVCYADGHWRTLSAPAVQ